MVSPTRIWCCRPKSQPLTHWAEIVAKLRNLRFRPSGACQMPPHIRGVWMRV